MTKTNESRFWEKVTVASPNECWEWTASTLGIGYGCFWLDGKSVLAHRVSWAWANDVDFRSMTDQEIVRHTCDNPPCVNPSHLLIGTHMDNVHDMIVRDRLVPPPSNYAFIDGRCQKGHDVTLPGGLHVRRSGERRCRVCYLETKRRNYHAEQQRKAS